MYTYRQTKTWLHNQDPGLPPSPATTPTPRPRPQTLFPGPRQMRTESPHVLLSGIVASVGISPLFFLTQIACGTKGTGAWIIYTVNIRQVVVYLNSSLLGWEIPWQLLRQLGNLQDLSSQPPTWPRGSQNPDSLPPPPQLTFPRLPLTVPSLSPSLISSLPLILSPSLYPASKTGPVHLL